MIIYLIYHICDSRRKFIKFNSWEIRLIGKTLISDIKTWIIFMNLNFGYCECFINIPRWEVLETETKRVLFFALSDVAALYWI